jgi:hypothetical protein
MKIEGNLSITDIISRHFAGLLIAIIGGFLGHYVSPIFYVLVIASPILIVTAILGWCPIYTLLGVNHTVKAKS